MKILAFDTATVACSTVVWCDGQFLARRLSAMERGHSETLMPMLAETLAEAGVGYQDLDCLAVTVGPGAFTGIRVGLATARGLALAAKLPCIGVNTLEAIAAAVPPEERVGRCVLAVIDSKRNDVFAQVFASDGAPLTESVVVAIEETAELIPYPAVVVAGDAASSTAECLAAAGMDAHIASVPGYPDAAQVANLAARRWDGQVAVPVPSPMYLRKPSAKRPIAGGRRRP